MQDEYSNSLRFLSAVRRWATLSALSLPLAAGAACAAAAAEQRSGSNAAEPSETQSLRGFGVDTPYLPWSGDRRFRDKKVIVDPGLGVGDGSMREETERRAMGTGSSSRTITDPGGGVGASLRTITDPGGGVGASLRTIIDPGGGVGASLRQMPPYEDIGYGQYVPVLTKLPSGMDLTWRRVPDDPAPEKPTPNAAAVTAATIGEGATAASQRLSPPPWSVGVSRFDAVPPAGVSPLNFMDLDSGLRDCEIPFEELKAKSPFCPKDAPPLSNGQRCEEFSYNQFPEVVRMLVLFPDNSIVRCTATMVASDWALTAAHCFLDETSTADQVGQPGKDFVWPLPEGDPLFISVMLEASNAKLLPVNGRRRLASHVIVYKEYGGFGTKPPYFPDDLALVQIGTPYPAEAMQPARLASAQQFNADTTIAGFGYTNAGGGVLDKFEVTWPIPVSQEKGQMSFVPQGPIRGSFCQGDSGGPVFAGRFRGCKPFDIAPEVRPRPLEGTISWNRPGKSDGGNEAAAASSACRNADEMAMQDITTAERHRWICRTTQNAPLGCP